MNPEIFMSKRDGEINLITMPMIVDHKNTAQFEAAQDEWLKNSCLVHVMDLARVVAIMPSSHTSFIRFHNSLREQDKSLFSINMPSNLLPRIKQEGLLSVFNPIENLDVVQRILEMKRLRREEAKSRILTDLINALTTSVDDFLRLKMGIEAVTSTPSLKNVGEYHLFHVGGLAELSVDNFEFSLLVQFDKNVFEDFFDYFIERESQKNADFEIEPMEDIRKSAKKILNPIFAQTKLILKEKKKVLFKQVNPNIIVGDCCKYHEHISAITMNFQTSLGNFRIEVGIL